MSGYQIPFHRGQRKVSPLPEGEAVVPNYPPEPTAPSRSSWLVLFAPAGAAVILGLFIGISSGNYSYAIVILCVAFVYPFAMILRQREMQKRWQEKREQVRSAFANRMREIERELGDMREQQISGLRSAYPSPEEAMKWAEDLSPSLWERRPGDRDFLELRLGIGEVASSYEVRFPHVDIPELASTELLSAIELAKGYQRIAGAPVAYPLGQVGSLAVTGPRHLRQSFCRSLICHIAATHAPNEVELFAIYPPDETGLWDWLKWLPHTFALESENVSAHLAYDPSSICQILSGVMDEMHAREVRRSESRRGVPEAEPSLVLFVPELQIVQGEAALRRILESGKEIGVSLIVSTHNPREVPEGCAGRVELVNEARACLFTRLQALTTDFAPDSTDLSLAQDIAHKLAPVRPAEAQGAFVLPDEIRLLDLLGLPHLGRLDLERRWLSALSQPPRMEATLGVRSGNRTLVIDLKQSGHGPHGLIAGTTGSGKSELLLTLLTSLALEHHPHQVNFVLVDYKGGTVMSVLEGLPHTVGVVTDLDGKQTRRALVALRSEMTRREEILARYQVADIDKYHELGYSEPFPYLLIVIDEFAELREYFKNDLGDILREIVSIAQKGRALGVHLLLAMQKPEGVINDSIRANTKYRICLRVERAEDSRNVLGRPDAYLLPHRPPGRAYFQVGKDERFDLFQVAKVAGYYRGEQQQASSPEASRTLREVGPDGRRIPLLELEPGTLPEEVPSETVQTEAQILVEKAATAAANLGIERLPSPWPPPLPSSLPLPDLLDRLPTGGWAGTGWTVKAEMVLRAPVGLLDDPAQQRQEPWVYEMANDGNLLAVGAPGSGRTTLLLTLLAGLARSTPPDQLHIHLVDYAGHQLRAACSRLPHVAGTYGPGEEEATRRLLMTLTLELDRRHDLFAETGVVSLDGYNRALRDTPPLPAILTTINNASGFLEAYSEETSGWIRLVREGAAYGVYFALTADRVPTARLTDLIQTRIALRLPDNTIYANFLGSRPDLTTFVSLPGRGFLGSKPPLEIQVALPASADPESQIRLLQEMGEKMRLVWQGSRPSPIRLLPEQVALADVLPARLLDPSATSEKLITWIGLDDLSVEPVKLDVEKIGPCLLVTGPPESGRTTALATIALALASTQKPDDLRMAVLAPSRAERIPLDALAALPHTLGFAKSEAAIADVLSTVEEWIKAHADTDSPDRRPAAHLVLLIDDYHMIAGRMSPGLVERLEVVARRGVEQGITTVVSVPTTMLSGMGDALIRHLKSWRTGLWLRSTEGMEASALGLRIPTHLRRKNLPPGRGFLYTPADQVLLQVATPEMKSPLRRNLPGTLREWMSVIVALWGEPV